MIGCTWGGTAACAWMDPEGLSKNGGRVWLEDYEKAVEGLDLAAYEENFAANPDNYKGKPFKNAFLEKMMYGMSMEELMAIVQEQAAAGNPAFIPLEGPKSEKRPGNLFQTMLKKTVPYSIRGFLWYQGENDDRHPGVYHEVFQELIRCWRSLWGEELPFLFVQLAPFHYWVEEGREIFPLLRREQQWVRDHTPNCFMASVMDAGMAGDIHPKRKRPVGERLALLARGHVYGEPVLCDPPEFTGAERTAGELRLRFSGAGSGLWCKGEKVEALEVFAEGERIQEYRAELSGDTLILTSEAFAESSQLEVRFAQLDYCEVNLYSSAGLTPLPFTWKSGGEE